MGSKLSEDLPNEMGNFLKAGEGYQSISKPLGYVSTVKILMQKWKWTFSNSRSERLKNNSKSCWEICMRATDESKTNSRGPEKVLGDKWN